MHVDILAFWAHPDDIELGCSWTLLKHISAWKSIGLCDLTQWELWTRWSAELRLQEAAKAQELMWANFRINLWMSDWFFKRNQSNLKKIISVIRSSTPEIVLLPAIDDRHPDHWRASKLIADACFYAGLIKIETWEAAHRPRLVLSYVQDIYLQPDIVVDISDVMDKKLELIWAFASQFHDPSSSLPETPISDPRFLDAFRWKQAVYWRNIWVAYAEGFLSKRTLWVASFFDLQ